MTLKLYFDFLSQPSRTLYIFLKTCNIAFEPRITQIVMGENMTEEYEKINPFCKLPAIEHDDFKLIESVGISRYLCREFKVADHWYPSSLKEQARVDEYLEWHPLNTRVFCARYFLAMVFFPAMRQKEPRAERKKMLEDSVIACLDAFENKWLMNRAFLMGDKISIADLFAACEIEQLRLANFEPRQGRPKLAGWLERVAQETAPHYAEAHRHIDAVIEKAGGRPFHTCSISVFR